MSLQRLRTHQQLYGDDGVRAAAASIATAATIQHSERSRRKASPAHQSALTSLLNHRYRTSPIGGVRAGRTMGVRRATRTALCWREKGSRSRCCCGGDRVRRSARRRRWCSPILMETMRTPCRRSSIGFPRRRLFRPRRVHAKFRSLRRPGRLWAAATQTTTSPSCAASATKEGSMRRGSDQVCGFAATISRAADSTPRAACGSPRPPSRTRAKDASSPSRHPSAAPDRWWHWCGRPGQDQRHAVLSASANASRSSADRVHRAHVARTRPRHRARALGLRRTQSPTRCRRAPGGLRTGRPGARSGAARRADRACAPHAAVERRPPDEPPPATIRAR